VESLRDLDTSLRKLGSRLYVLEGDPVQVLPQHWKEWNISHIYFEEDETGEPYALQRDDAIRKAAKEQDIPVHACCSETLYPLKAYVSKAGSKLPNTMGSFQKVFAKMPPLQKPKPAPTAKDFPPQQEEQDEYSTQFLVPTKLTDLPWPRSVPKEELDCLWGPNDCQNLTPIVRGGETEALAQLQRKMRNASWVASFEKPKTSCTEPNNPSTTVLSPYMSLGCLSPRTFWYAIDEAIRRTNTKQSKPPVSLHGQLLWRDFNNLMAHSANKAHPASWCRMKDNMYCREIPWDDNTYRLDAWKNGQTGYPYIDACMMQLKTEGWIHHLGRHAVACFLTRGDLWQSWERGAEHFESHLLDADYGLNGFNWLWLSCSGFFYQYFRCYSPVAFQKKNDPSGTYIRKFLPVLAKLPNTYIYEPWKAPAAVLKTAGIKLGVDYPRPIVDHSVVSKENMSKMADAYAKHKAKAAESSGASPKQPPKKKTKRATKQTKLKF